MCTCPECDYANLDQDELAMHWLLEHARVSQPAWGTDGAIVAMSPCFCSGGHRFWRDRPSSGFPSHCRNRGGFLQHYYDSVYSATGGRVEVSAQS